MRTPATVLVLGALAAALTAQDEPVKPFRSQYFSGTIVAVDAGSLTVRGPAGDRDAGTRRFRLTRETRVEGVPHVRATATVRFSEHGGHLNAVYVLVRAITPRPVTGVSQTPPPVKYDDP